MKLPEQDKIANEMYEAAARSRLSQERRNYLGMSAIGGACERKLWFSFRGFFSLPIEGRSIMIFRFGDHIEEDVIGWLRAAGYDVQGQQDSFKDHGGWFSGHCDGIIHGISQQPHILEVKSAKDKKFKSFKGFGVQKTYQLYYDQVQCYMGYAGLERALVVVQNKDTCEIYTERIYFNPEEFQALQKKAYRVITANDPTGQPFHEDSFECRYCDFRVTCRRPAEAILEHIDCMTCQYHRWAGLVRWCTFPAHTFEILQRSGRCPDWKAYEVM